MGAERVMVQHDPIPPARLRWIGCRGYGGDMMPSLCTAISTPLMPNSPRRAECNDDRPRLLIAVGGNAIHPGRGPGTVEEQREYAARTGRALLPIMRADNELVITHGNGPVVGKILMRQVLSRERVPPMSMDVCVAHSQGGIAYLLMQSLENTLREAGNDRHVVCLLTQVEVDPDDPAFENPTKPIGFFYDEDEAKAIADNLGWTMRDDAGRGWRCVVPSPRPKHIVDISLIDAVAKSGAVVIAGGGGGIPVIRTKTASGAASRGSSTRT